MACSCEHGNDSLRSVTGGKFLDKLSDCYILRKGLSACLPACLVMYFEEDADKIPCLLANCCCHESDISVSQNDWVFGCAIKYSVFGTGRDFAVCHLVGDNFGFPPKILPIYLT
jgi:hypothetical protein